MIKDIPTRADFDDIGNALLQQAWQELISILIEADTAEDWFRDDDVEEYWRSATTKLTTTLAIAHQAAEFFVKGRIVEVSPFLLIANSAKEWPSADSDGHTSFSKFRTVDAQDLIRLHDRSAAAPLDGKLKERLEDLRVRRNSIMHTVDKGLEVKLSELVASILAIHLHLVGGSWIAARRLALHESMVTRLYSYDWIEPRLVEEFLAAEAVLSHAEVEQYFGVPSKQRRYICSNCTWDTLAEHERDVFSAVLKPNAPDSTHVWCAVCDRQEEVDRADCGQTDCPGNVISRDWDRCLTCGFDCPDVRN